MTVEEAKEKKCCNGMQIVGGNGHCIIDQCMAWRWFDPAIKNEGYCGLAGKEGAE